MCELITGQISFKGDFKGALTPSFPFDEKGELSVMNVELLNGK